MLSDSASSTLNIEFQHQRGRTPASETPQPNGRAWSVFKSLLIAAVLLLGLTALQPAHSKETPYETLANILEDPQSREQLINELRTMAPAGPAENTPAPAAASQASEDASTPQRLAASLQNASHRLTSDLSSAAAAIKSLAQGELPPESRMQGVDRQLEVLFIVLLTVLIAYLVLRLAAARAFARLSRWTAQARPQAGAARDAATASPRHGKRHLALNRKLLGVSAALVVDLAATLLAALAGYVAAAISSDQTANAMSFAFQFLTAFVMIEVAKALSRGVFATRYEHLRLLPLSRETAHYWNRWLSLLISLTGYCLLVVVPITQAVLLPSLGRLLGLVIMLGVYIYGVRVVWSNRNTVRAGLIEWARNSSAAVFGTLIRIFARLWHLLAMAYLTVLLVASQADQQQALSFMVGATVQSAIAIVLGALAAAALTALLTRHIAVPEHWGKALPLLEARINSYVPAALKGLRLLILILVALVVLDAWHAFDLGAWLTSDSGLTVITVLLRVGFILAIAALSWTILASVIEHRLGAASAHHRPTEREKTLLMLFRNAAAVVIATMTVLVVLSQIGINIGPLIAGAGVAGLAIGFGAQKLVQDVITGLFIQLENGMNQNDIVEVVGLFGTVEKITIRSVVIRTLDGGYHLIPFSSIDKLSNHTRDYGYHYAEYYIAHRENVDEAIAQMNLAYKDLMQDAELAPEVLEEISIPGVTALNERGFSIRVLIKTTPGNQWAVQRGYNRLLKQRFDQAGIELPYPQSVLHFGRDKSGYASPVDVRAVDSLREFTATKPSAN